MTLAGLSIGSPSFFHLFSISWLLVCWFMLLQGGGRKAPVVGLSRSRGLSHPPEIFVFAVSYCLASLSFCDQLKSRIATSRQLAALSETTSYQSLRVAEVAWALGVTFGLAWVLRFLRLSWLFFVCPNILRSRNTLYLICIVHMCTLHQAASRVHPVK